MMRYLVKGHLLLTAPLTMQIYEGEVEPWLMSDYCTDTVPVLLRRATFCRAFAADAKDFRSYNSWVSASCLCGASCERTQSAPSATWLYMSLLCNVVTLCACCSPD